MSSSRCVVFFRRSSSFCLSACTIVSLTTMCWSSRTSMTNSLWNSLSILTMIDLIDASHSTRTPVACEKEEEVSRQYGRGRGEEGWEGATAGQLLASYGSWHRGKSPLEAFNRPGKASLSETTLAVFCARYLGTSCQKGAAGLVVQPLEIGVDSNKAYGWMSGVFAADYVGTVDGRVDAAS